MANVKDLDEIAGPENLLETLRETASGYELQLLESVLSCLEYKYIYKNEVVIAIKED